MAVCQNPIAWDQLVKGTKYTAYPKAANGDAVLFTGWFSGYGAARGPSTTVVFRTDAPDDPNVAEEFQNMVGFGHIHKPDPNGEYEVHQAMGHRGIMEAGEYRYCEVDAGMEVEGDVAMAVEDGGRRKRRGKTRKSRRRNRKTKRRSK